MPRPPVTNGVSLGRRKRRRRDADRIVLSIPRLNPEWELGVVRALVKPQTKGAIEHRPGLQSLDDDWQSLARHSIDRVRDTLGFAPNVHFCAEGDFHLIAEIDRAEETPARALAVVLSRRLPETWLRLGRLYLRGGAFYRRERGIKLNLVRASNVHLPKDVRVEVERMLRQ